MATPMRAAPPPQWAAAYRYLDEEPPPAPFAALADPGESAPEGCFTSGGNTFWTVAAGPVLVRSHGVEYVFQGHRWIDAARVDLYFANGRELERVFLPSTTLSADVSHLTRWTPIRAVRDGARKPWRALVVPEAAWHERAEELNRRDA
ncbi:hypothetical protein [Streptomyces sp. NPDC048340]|uniref:hypothetical protein n=1 Tax=Streptomyces sp. NPDC048340 TaxID=3365537 RepID=UPI00371C5086